MESRGAFVLGEFLIWGDLDEGGEVTEFRPGFGGDDDVVWFYVSMGEVLFVEVVQGVKDDFEDYFCGVFDVLGF